MQFDATANFQPLSLIELVHSEYVVKIYVFHFHKTTIH